MSPGRIRPLKRTGVCAGGACGCTYVKRPALGDIGVGLFYGSILGCVVPGVANCLLGGFAGLVLNGSGDFVADGAQGGVELPRGRLHRKKRKGRCEDEIQFLHTDNMID